MSKSQFENGSLLSMFQDIEVMESLRENSDLLKEDFARDTGSGANEGLESFTGEEGPLSGLDVLLEGRETTPGGFGEREAIILLTGRPPLLVQGGTWEEPRIPEIKRRLDHARGFLETAIPRVARIELLNSPTKAYVGTGWMIGDDVMITNRHVALEFARKNGTSILLRTTPFGEPLHVAADFNQEFQTPNAPFEVRMKEVLFIEEDSTARPDMALIRLDSDGIKLPEPIELSSLVLQRDDDVAVIGYPARDAGRNDPFEMQRLFRGIYDVKRLSPGRISGVRADRFILTHDCTTLGGNSGSVVINLQDGKAAGLHFAGSFRENNFAVTSETLREKLANLGRRLVVSVSPGILPEDEGPSESELRSRPGYDESFLGHSVPLPDPGSHDLAPVKERDDSLLHYLHFSVAMHKSRRLALFTACNIDGGKLYSVRRGRDRWSLDPRLDDDFQVGNDLYRSNPLDRGHLVRRLDPAWGDSRAEAVKAADDTFFYTNAHPQHSRLNQSTWLSLEDHILDNAATHDLKVTVFTGPIFSERDREYRGILIPQEYWKVVTIVNVFTGTLSATGYLLSQTEFVDNLEFVFGEFRTYQLPIRTLEQKTGLTFGTLPDHDPLGINESTGPRTIEGPADLLI